MKFSTALLVAGALVLVRADDDCISTCESSTASSLGCDASDISGCYCLDDFATDTKACLYENSCDDDVATFYSTHDDTCASVSVTTTISVSSTTTTATPSQSAACISTCEQTAADSLDCDITDLSTCFCIADFAEATKQCLYETDGCDSDVNTFYESYNAACVAVSVSTTATSATASATSAASATATATSGAAATTSAEASTGDANSLSVGLSMGVGAIAMGIAALL